MMRERVDLASVAARVSCVIVHHKNFPDVLKTIDAILLTGVSATRMVVVDNSDDGSDAAVATERPSLSVISVENAGYAHAVNAGVRFLSLASPESDLILVATHEVRPVADAVVRLVGAFADTAVGVAGPTLLDRRGGGVRVWSSGGRISRVLRRPQHLGMGQAPGVGLDGVTVNRHWLDGAFCLYRRSLLEATPLEEVYKMYFEEVDLHTRLRRAGWRVVCVPAALVAQSSNGAPSYYVGRNMCIFQHRFGTSFSRVAASPAMAAAALRRDVRRWSRGEPSRDTLDYLRGWADGRASVRGVTASETRGVR